MPDGIGWMNAQVHRRHLEALGARAVDRLLDRALGAAPADDAAGRRRGRRSTGGVFSVFCSAASLRLRARSPSSLIVGSYATLLARSCARPVSVCMPPGWPGNEAARDAGDRIPVVGLGAVGHRRLVDRRREPVLAELRPRERLLRGGEARVRQHHHDHVEGLGDLARRDDRIEAVLDVARRHHDLGRVAVAAVDGGQQVALLDLGRLAGATARRAGR